MNLKFFKTKKFWYIFLFSLLYGIVAFSSFFHACSFFGLANNEWMSIILAFAFEVGQAAVLFSLLTSQKDRGRMMPWVLMIMFTLVQVIGNVFSSYKYIMTNSIADLRYFKEPIFIWTTLPDDQATVIVTYIVGAILPICSLLLTSMITNYLTDESDQNKKSIEEDKQSSKEIEEDKQSSKEIEEDKQEDNRKDKLEDKLKDNLEDKLKDNLEDKPEENLKKIENEFEDIPDNIDNIKTEDRAHSHFINI